MSIKCKATLFVDTKSRGYAYFGTPPPIGVDVAGGTGYRSVDVEIQNGRGNSDLTLDEASFELVKCPTKLSTEDFYKMQESKDKALVKQYQDEVSDFLKAKLECDKVICLHSQVRNQSRSKAFSSVQPYAAGSPHTNSSSIDGDETALWLLEQARKAGDVEAKNDTYRRYLYLNLWQNISSDPIEDYPLAMLDERTTIKPDDYLARDLFMPHWKIVQYGLNARHSHVHKWYYFPRMTKSEGILFKQIDSDWTKPSRMCFHMAVKDPGAPEDAKPRESIELRVFCCWKEAAVDSMRPEDILAEDAAQNMSSSVSNVRSASAVQLLGALFFRLPLVGTISTVLMSNPMAQMIMMKVNSYFIPYPPYSGDPESYVERLQASVNLFAMWPSFARKGIENMMTGKTLEEASEYMASMLVDDSLGTHKTKRFSKDDKAAIVKACMRNQAFLKAVSENLGSVLATNGTEVTDHGTDTKKGK